MGGRPANLPELDAARLQEIRNLLTHESSISFQSGRAHESMWMLFSAAQRGLEAIAAIKAEAIREAAQVQRQYAADARTQYGEAEHTNIADWLDEHVDTIADADSDPTKAAVDVIAREVTEQMLDPMDLGDLWSDYPEIGEDDWSDVTARIRARAEAAKPDVETYKTAYAHLQGRAEAWAAENDPA